LIEFGERSIALQALLGSRGRYPVPGRNSQKPRDPRHPDPLLVLRERVEPRGLPIADLAEPGGLSRIKIFGHWEEAARPSATRDECCCDIDAVQDQ